MQMNWSAVRCLLIVVVVLLTVVVLLLNVVVVVALLLWWVCEARSRGKTSEGMNVGSGG